MEALEKQLIPPDITTDMYDWNESDNEDYLNFLKGFMSSVEPTTVEANDDEEADPEYNVMEDEEDVHDQEELRMDRAVKVSKKELNELISELFDNYQLSSGDEFEDISSSVAPAKKQSVESSKLTTVPVRLSPTKPITPTPSWNMKEKEDSAEDEKSENIDTRTTVPLEPPIHIKSNELDHRPLTPPGNYLTPSQSQNIYMEPSQSPLFNEARYKTLQHQMQQHVQLLTQSYVLSAQVEQPLFVKVAHTSKSLLVSIKY